jgi:hypothetical protein
VTEPTPPPTAPLFVLQLGPNEVYVRLDGGEEDSTEWTSDEIRRFCAEIKQRFAEDLGIALEEPDSIHVRLTEDDPGTEVWSWTPPPPPVSDETKG